MALPSRSHASQETTAVNEFTNFEMPGGRIPGFRRHAIAIAKAGVYNLRVHHDHVIQPLIRDWKIGSLLGLTSEAAALQEEIMALPADLIARAEVFEERTGGAGAKNFRPRA